MDRYGRGHASTVSVIGLMLRHFTVNLYFTTPVKGARRPVLTHSRPRARTLHNKARLPGCHSRKY